MVEVELKNWGNSMGVIIPIEKIKELGLRKGDKIDIDIVKKERIDGFGIARGFKRFKEEKVSDFW
ncbi:MAG TPA: hypothetical protein VJH20_02735 [Candidatus Nanoarchaeia archaeon]|nr:hypothetical protein [Candidatus Nanoarchaeia archaeon]